MWGRRLPAAGLEARLPNTPMSNPSPSLRVVQAKQQVTPLSAASHSKTRVYCTSGDNKPDKHGAVARQKGLDHAPDTPAAEAAARPPSTARQPVPGQCFEEAPSSADTSKPPSGSRSSRRKKAQQVKLASAQSNNSAQKPASVRTAQTESVVNTKLPMSSIILWAVSIWTASFLGHTTALELSEYAWMPGEVYIADNTNSADLGMLQIEPLPSSVLLDTADVPRPSTRQGRSLLGPGGAADGRCSDESPSHDFRLHTQPHRWSPIPAENGHAPSTALAPDRTAQAASAPGQASSALGVPGGQGTEARPQSRAARTLPLTQQPAAGAAAQPALADVRHAAAAAGGPAVAAGAPEAGMQVNSLSKQAATQAAGAPYTDLPCPAEQGEPAAVQLQGVADACPLPACTQPISAAPADGGRIRQAVHVAARLHACVLGSCASLAVLSELELLVQLMTLPLHCKQGPSSSSATHARTWDWQILSSPEDAAAYGCATLEHCGERSVLPEPSISRIKILQPSAIS